MPRSATLGMRAVPAPTASADPRRRWLGQDLLVEAQRLANRPGLKRAAARRVRRLGVHDLRDVSQAALLDVAEQGNEQPSARLTLHGKAAAAHAYPGFHEWAEQPGPGGTLMVGAVPSANVAFVASDITRVVGRERPESQRRPQARLDRVHDTS